MQDGMGRMCSAFQIGIVRLNVFLNKSTYFHKSVGPERCTAKSKLVSGNWKFFKNDLF